ncbi:MAG: Crp/Fnr family transcriptional regulator [Nitrospirales bacterium]
MINTLETNAQLECSTCSYRKTADVCSLAPDTLRNLQHSKQSMVCRPGQYVFYEGHPVLAVYVLCQGRVKLTRLTKKGQQRVMKIVEPGQVLEWNLYRNSAVHEATGETLSSARICVIDRLSFLNLVEQDSRLAFRLLTLMSQERVASLSYEDQLAFSSARERIVKLLENLAERYGEAVDDGVAISLLLKREELAQMAALTLETTVRILKSLEAIRMIRLSGRTITILRNDYFHGRRDAVSTVPKSLR